MYFNFPRLFVLLSLVAVCVVADAQVPEPQVAGRVVRSDNGQPIEGATVELERAWIASSNGQYPTAISNKNREYRPNRLRRLVVAVGSLVATPFFALGYWSYRTAAATANNGVTRWHCCQVPSRCRGNLGSTNPWEAPVDSRPTVGRYRLRFVVSNPGTKLLRKSRVILIYRPCGLTRRLRH